MTRATGVTFLAFSLSAALVANAHAQVRVESFSGSGQAGFTNSDGQVGQFNRPHGLAIDGKGNIYVSDRGNHAIRVVTAFGDIRTLAGNGKEGNANGVGATASFKQPTAVAVDKAGTVYVADRDNHLVRAINPAGKVLVLAGTGTKGFANGPASSAQFNEPYGVALSPDERTLYVADYLNHAIRAIDLAARQVTTLAGNGTAGFANGVGDKAQFNQPYNVKADPNGRLYVPDQNNHCHPSGRSRRDGLHCCRQWTEWICRRQAFRSPLQQPHRAHRCHRGNHLRRRPQ